MRSYFSLQLHLNNHARDKLRNLIILIRLAHLPHATSMVYFRPLLRQYCFTTTTKQCTASSLAALVSAKYMLSQRYCNDKSRLTPFQICF